MNRQRLIRILKAAWWFFSRCFVMAGLPLIAWGLGDLAGFLSNPARASFIGVVAAQALALAWLSFVAPLEPKREWRSILGHYHADLFEFIFILVAYNDRRSMLTMPENVLLRFTGLAIFLAGMLIPISANFTWVRHLRNEPGDENDHPVLLNKGFYRWVRYPKQLALLLECLGAALIFRSWAGLVLLVPELASILNQIGVMERAFSEQYRRAWQARCQSSKKLIPFLY